MKLPNKTYKNLLHVGSFNASMPNIIWRVTSLASNGMMAHPWGEPEKSVWIPIADVNKHFKSMA